MRAHSPLAPCLHARNAAPAAAMLRIRLARLGRRNLPFYRLVVAEDKAPRDGRHLEVVGHYDPAPAADGNKHVAINFDRVKYWLAVGAQPSDRVWYLLSKAGIVPPPPPTPRPIQPNKDTK